MSKEADGGGVNDLTNIFYSPFRSSHSKLISAKPGKALLASPMNRLRELPINFS